MARRSAPARRAHRLRPLAGDTLRRQGLRLEGRAGQAAGGLQGDHVLGNGFPATVTPVGACLLCLSGYDPAAASRELDPALTAAKRAAGYLRDAPDEPTPSVIFLNQAIASVALGEALNILTGWHPPRPYTLIDLSAPALTPIHANPEPDCPACGPNSPRALGDAAPPPHFTEPSPPPPP